MEKHEEALQETKERSKWRIHFMARYVNEKPQILQLAGKKYMEIYLRRNFVEIDKETFDRLAKELRG